VNAPALLLWRVPSRRLPPHPAPWTETRVVGEPAARGRLRKPQQDHDLPPPTWSFRACCAAIQIVPTPAPRKEVDGSGANGCLACGP
jgi:hypothetical protein